LIQKDVYHIISCQIARNVFPKIYKPLKKKVAHIRSRRPLVVAVGPVGQTEPQTSKILKFVMDCFGTGLCSDRSRVLDSCCDICL